jgi:hypothetical protein
MTIMCIILLDIIVLYTTVGTIIVFLPKLRNTETNAHVEHLPKSLQDCLTSSD